jgi:outer membrane protein assembly factor BamA
MHPKLCCFPFILCCLLNVSAQELLPKTIQFQGGPEYANQELLDVAGLKPGVELTSTEMNEHAKRLMDTGVFDSLSYKFDGTDLIFTVVPAADMYPVRIGDLPLQPGAELDARLHEELPLYHGKVPAKGGLLDGVRLALERMLASEGVTAEVAVSPYADKWHQNKVTAMSFSIAGMAVRLGRVHVTGASDAMLPEIQTVWSQESILPFGSETSIVKLEHQIISLYQEKGYATAKVNVSFSGTLSTAGNALLIPIAVTVQEGPHYKIGTISVPGGALVTQEEVDKALRTPLSGAVGLRRVLFLITERYKSKGYLDVVVTPHPQLHDDQNVVDYILEVESGWIYHFAFVKFVNFSDALRQSLMRQWQLLPGDVFNETYLDIFVERAKEHDAALRQSLASALTKYEISVDPVNHEASVEIRLETP